MTISWVLFGLVFVMLCISLFYNYKFARIILRMEDAVEESLERLDDSYGNISKILEIPLFYDSPQIRQVVKDIRQCQNSILYVATQIAQIEETIDGQEEKKEN